MFLSHNFYLVFYALFCLIQIESGYFLVYTLHVRRSSNSNSFSIIELHPEEWYGELFTTTKSSELENHDESIVPDLAFNFTSIKDQYRTECYAKAILAGTKDNRAQHKKEMQLGFSKIPIKKTVTDGKLNRQKKIVCYYNVPTMYDTPYPVFPEQIDPRLCTHIIIGFARVFNLSLVPNEQRDLEFYSRTIKLKKKNPDLKIMVGVGSTNDGSASSEEFVNMMKSKETRGLFIQQSLRFLKSFGFDGVEIDWEYPAFNGPLEQKDQLTALLNEFKLADDDFILSVAVPAIKLVIDLGYDIPAIAKVVDFVDLMCYDYHHFSWMTPLTGPNSPLYQESSEIGFFKTLNMDWSSKYYYSNGMAANKIIVGMPTYGHSYELADERHNSYYSVAKGFGKMGSNGFVSYVPICNFLNQNGTLLVLGNDTREPYAYRNKEWISFDNEQSAKEKAEYVKSMDFGGMMFYSLNSDDAWKICNTSKTVFPIIQTAKDHLIGINQ